MFSWQGKKWNLDFEAEAGTIQECEGTKGCTSAAKEGWGTGEAVPSTRQGNQLHVKCMQHRHSAPEGNEGAGRCNWGAATRQSMEVSRKVAWWCGRKADVPLQPSSGSTWGGWTGELEPCKPNLSLCEDYGASLPGNHFQVHEKLKGKIKRASTDLSRANSAWPTSFTSTMRWSA